MSVWAALHMQVSQVLMSSWRTEEHIHCYRHDHFHPVIFLLAYAFLWFLLNETYGWLMKLCGFFWGGWLFISSNVLLFERGCIWEITLHDPEENACSPGDTHHNVIASCWRKLILYLLFVNKKLQPLKKKRFPLHD